MRGREVTTSLRLPVMYRECDSERRRSPLSYSLPLSYKEKAMKIINLFGRGIKGVSIDNQP